MFLVRSLANSATGSENARETAIGIILRTRPDSLKYTCAVTTWLNDCHKFIHCNLRASTTIKVFTGTLSNLIKKVFTAMENEA